MYCVECGSSNPEGMQYCQECGKKLKTFSEHVMFNSTSDIVVKKKIALMPEQKRRLLICGFVILFLILCVIIINALNDPLRIARGYMKAEINNDYDKLYSYLNVEDEGFTSKTMYLSTHQNSFKSSLDIVNYVIEENSASEGMFEKLLGINDSNVNKLDLLTKDYTISYTLDGDPEIHTKRLTLLREKNDLLIFRKWRVAAENTVMKNVLMIVPGGANVKINDVDLPESLLAADNALHYEYGESFDSERNQIYLIPQIFPGYYDVTVNFPFAEECQTAINIESDISNQFFPIEFNVTPTLTDQSVETLRSQALLDITNLYHAAIENKEFGSIENLFLSNDYSWISPESSYSDLVYNLSNYIKLNNIEFTISQEQPGNDIIYQDDTAQITVNVLYTYELTYDDWDDTVTYQETSPQSGDIQLSYSYINGEWKLKEWPMMNISLDY
jgi:hypothetical protein